MWASVSCAPLPYKGKHSTGNNVEKSLYLLLYLLLLINSTLSISVVVPSLALKCTPALEEVSSFALSGCKCKLKKLMPILSTFQVQKNVLGGS